MDGRVVLDFTDKGPICLAGIELATGTTVDGEGCDTYILQAVCYLLDIFRVIIPTQASLDGNGFLYGIDNLARHLDHKRHIAHHT